MTWAFNVHGITTIPEECKVSPHFGFDLYLNHYKSIDTCSLYRCVRGDCTLIVKIQQRSTLVYALLPDIPSYPFERRWRRCQRLIRNTECMLTWSFLHSYIQTCVKVWQLCRSPEQIKHLRAYGAYNAQTSIDSCHPEIPSYVISKYDNTVDIIRKSVYMRLTCPRIALITNHRRRISLENSVSGGSIRRLPSHG